MISLAEKDDIIRWCEEIRLKLETQSPADIGREVVRLLNNGESIEGLVGQIVHATWGYNMLINEFYLVIRETESAALLMKLQSDAGEEQTGKESPVIPNEDDVPSCDKLNYIRAEKSMGEKELYLSGDRFLFRVWKGEPCYFNYID